MNMKRKVDLVAVCALALGLTACGSKSTATPAGSSNPDRLNAGYANALPVETQLILGTLKLEGTPQAVDTATAAKLIPLYTLLQQMTTSGTAAQAEIDAVLEQIQATMTTDQIHAIAAMKLTPADMTTFFTSFGRFARTGTGTPGAGFGGGGGGFPGGGGGFPGGGGGAAGGRGGGGGGGGFPGGGGGAAGGGSSIATLRAQRTGTPRAGGSATFLIPQLIQVLQRKTQTLTPAENQTSTESQTPTENLTPTAAMTPTP